VNEELLEALQKYYPGGFVLLRPKDVGEGRETFEVFFCNPEQRASIDQVVDDLVWNYGDRDTYWGDNE